MAGNIWNYKNNLRNIPETKCNPSVTVFWQHETDGKSHGKDDSSLNFPHHSQSQSNQIGLCFFRTLHNPIVSRNTSLIAAGRDIELWQGFENIGRLIWGLADLKLWQKPEGEGEGALIFVKPAVGAGFTGIAGGVDLQNPLICWCHLSLKFKDTENQYTIDALA